MAILYLSMTDRAKLGRCYFLDSSIADRNNNTKTRWLPDPWPPAVPRSPRYGRRAGPLVASVMLAKLVPGKLFSPTALGRYYHKNRRGMSVEAKLTAELGP